MTTMPPLPSRAEFLREQAEREREHGVIWHEKFTKIICQKIYVAAEHSTEEARLE